MIKTYNIGIECYALLTSPSDPEFLIPVKAKIMDKYINDGQVVYCIRITDVFETNFKLLKENLNAFKVSRRKESGYTSALIKKPVLDEIQSKEELLEVFSKDSFWIEDNYVTLNKDDLYELCGNFIKYLITYHYKRLYELTSRSFLANSPIFENQKEMFKKRIETVGFKDMFDKFNFEIKL